MKRKLGAVMLVVALVLTLGLAPFAYAAKPIPTMLDNVDIGDTSSEAGHSLMGWGPIEPITSGGNWGGIAPGTCRVVSYAGDPTPGYATLTLDTTASDVTGFARHIKMRVLDGIADDSFNVYVKNPGGDWALVYNYTSDPLTSEYWVVHDIYGFPAGKGMSTAIEIKIEATGAAWGSFNTYGQLAVDRVEVLDH